MKDVYVLGVGMIKFGRYPDKDVSQLGAEAALGALTDAGMSIKDIEMFVCGNLFQANAMKRPEDSAAESGRPASPSLTSPTPARPGSTAFREAYVGVASGHVRCHHGGRR